MNAPAAAAAASAADGDATIDGSSLSELAGVREMLDFLAQNRLEAVRIDVSEDDASSNSDDGDTGNASSRTARRKFVLRRRRRFTGAAATIDPTLSPPAATANAGRDGEANALSDLASVTEMLDFLAQNRLEGVRIEPPDGNSDESDGGGSGGMSRNPVQTSRLHDLANVHEMLEFLAQNRLERVRIEIPEAGDNIIVDSRQASADNESTTAEQQQRQELNRKQHTMTTTTKKRKRSETVLARDRDFAKTVYYKTLTTLKELQDEAARLEAEHKTLVERHRSNRQPHQTRAVHDPDGSDERREYKERYVDLVLEREALQTENRALEEQSAALEKLRADLVQLTGVEIRANARAFADWGTERPREDEVRPVTLEYCEQVTDRAYDRMLEFRERSPSSFTWGADLFGWKDFRSIENNCLTYSLEKIFLFQKADQIAAKFWEMTSIEESAQRCYSPSLKVRFHILQHVDENNIVIYRTIDRVGGVNGMEQRMKTVVLVSRVFLGVEEGWIIFFCALDPARVFVRLTAPPKGRTRLEPMREEMWIDNLKWMICEPMGESAQHCKQIFGGVLDGVATANSSQWILEELMVGIRYERGGAGPFNILYDDE